MVTIFNDPNNYTSSNSTLVSNSSFNVTFDPAYTNDVTSISTWGSFNTTSSTSWTSQSLLKLKICRTCKHGHMTEGPGCIDQVGQMMAFVDSCICKEYVPTENLEYLEWCYEKKKQKGT